MQTAPFPVHRVTVPTPFAVGPVNAYLIGAEPLTLVDCGPGTDEAWRGLRAGVEAAGHRLENIRRLVLTHPHHDHAGLARRVQDISGCSIYGHSLDHPRLRDEPGEWDAFVGFLLEGCRRAGVPVRYRVALDLGLQGFRQYADPIDRLEPLGEGDGLAFRGFRLAVLHTTGHARGALCLWESGSRCLISGDTVLPGISSNAILEPSPRGFRQRTLLEYVKTLKRLAGLAVRWVLPGHGDELGEPQGNEDVLAPLVAQRLDFYERRAREILELVDQGIERPWDIVMRLFPDLDPSYAFLGVSEVVGHLDLLADRGDIEFEGQEGEWRARIRNRPGVGTTARGVPSGAAGFP